MFQIPDIFRLNTEERQLSGPWSIRDGIVEKAKRYYTGTELKEFYPDLIELRRKYGIANLALALCDMYLQTEKSKGLVRDTLKTFFLTGRYLFGTLFLNIPLIGIENTKISYTAGYVLVDFLSMDRYDFTPFYTHVMEYKDAEFDTTPGDEEEFIVTHAILVNREDGQILVRLKEDGKIPGISVVGGHADFTHHLLEYAYLDRAHLRELKEEVKIYEHNIGHVKPVCICVQRILDNEGKKRKYIALCWETDLITKEVISKIVANDNNGDWYFTPIAGIQNEKTSPILRCILAAKGKLPQPDFRIYRRSLLKR